MLENAKPLFSLMGFQVKLDSSWLLLAGLISWSLAVGYYPQELPGLPPKSYWLMGFVSAIGIFFSIVLHELSHSVVARRFGIPINGITLFIFGGVAEMTEEPNSAKGEFWMAIAGPIMSLVLALLCYTSSTQLNEVLGPEISIILSYLARVNTAVAVFNMLPGFPLDGGRIFRSALWAWKGNFKWATNIATKTGSAIATGLMFFALFNLFSGNIFGGIWIFVIAMFLKMAAKSSQVQMLLKENLTGRLVKEFMFASPIAVPKQISLDELVSDYFLKQYHKMYPVVDGTQPIGFISSQEVKQIPEEQRPQTSVERIYVPIDDSYLIKPNDDVLLALKTMNSKKLGRLLVVENEKLVGVITLKDLLQFIATKIEFEGN